MADEYIRKADVLNLPQNIERDFKGEIVERSVDVGAIEALPAADVMQVVRCKDCRYRVEPDKCCHPDGMLRSKDSDFCSYGEREE